MAEPITTIDPRIYGGQAPTGNAVPEFDPMKSVPPQVQPAPAPEQVPQDAIGAGSVSATVGQNVIAQRQREVASVGSAAQAAMKTWSPVRVWDYINMPHFDVDPGFDVKPYINSVPFTMSEEEHRFMAEAKSEEDFSYRLQSSQEQRKLYQTMGDHPVISGLVGLADPGYLALDLASFGVGRLAGAVGAGIRGQRIAAGIAGASSTFGLGVAQQQVVPMSDTEVLLPALLSGAANAMFYKAGKGMVKADPTYPSDELGRLVADIQGQGVGVEKRVAAEQTDVAGVRPTDVVAPTEQDVYERTVKAVLGQDAEAVHAKGSVTPVVDEVTPTRRVVDGEVNNQLLTRRGVTAEERANSENAYTHLAQYENDPQYGSMIRTLRAEQPDLLGDLKVVQSQKLGDMDQAFYLHGDHTAYVGKGPGNKSPAFAALHEVIHGLTAAKIEYGKLNPGSAHGALVAQLDALRLQAKRAIEATKGSLGKNEAYLQSYYTKNLHEFAAGLFSGEGRMSGGFVKALSKMEADGAPNLLSKVTNTVRKLLGLPPNQQSVLTKALGLTDDLINTKLDLSIHGELPGGRRTIEPVAVFNLAPKGTPSQQATTIINKMESRAAKLGQKISWSLHKTMSNLSTEGKRIANILVDDPINMTGDSVVSQKQAIRSDLSALQYVYEDALKAEMATRGAGLRNRIMNPAAASQIQRTIEREVYDELQRRWAVGRRGGNINDPSVNKAIAKMADAHDAATAAGGREMQTAGVLGADGFEIKAGYATRKWSVTQIEDAEGRFIQSGLSEKEAKRAVRDLVSTGIQRANPDWEPDLAKTVASAVVERARRKGYFEDAALRGHVGNGGAAEIRDILEQSGASQAHVQRALDVVTGVTDEAGKASNLKHRIDMDMSASTQLSDGTTMSISDLVDTNVTRNLNNYLDNSAGNAALARKGLPSTSDIAKLRTEYLRGIATESGRAEGSRLFDNVIASIKGQPVGEEIPDGMKKVQAVTQMVGLASSGLWQIVEYANAAAKFGLMKTTAEIVRTMPVFKQLLANPLDGGHANLAHILERNSAQDLRIRPYIQKMEDNFEMKLGDHAMLVAQQAKQMVPYINAMHYIHHNQAKVVGNLVADLFQQGALGNVKAREMLAKYGLEGRTLDSIASDVKAHGLNTEKWSDATWAQVRGPLGKMVDDTVLNSRTGEIPAFAQFSSVGKFIFTFRAFMLGEHNKVLAGTLGRQGFGGLALLGAYQFPLAMLASQAKNVMAGKPPMDPGALASETISQVGALGMFSDLWGIVSGQDKQFGGSGLIAIDRLYKIGNAAGAGNAGATASAVINATPLLSIMPGIKALASSLQNTQPTH